MLADNILYAGSLLPSLSRPVASRRLRCHRRQSPPSPLTTESTTIHPGFLRQFLPVLLEQTVFRSRERALSKGAFFITIGGKKKIIADCFVAIMPPGIGNKRAQQLRLARKKLAEKQKLARQNSQLGGHAQPEVHPNFAVCGKPKGAEAVLRERGLWPYNSWHSDGFKFKLECPKDCGGCNPELDGTTGCCARRVLSQQQDFRERKDNCERRPRLQITSLSSTRSSIVS